MSTTSDNTNLVHTEDSAIVIPTLDTGTSFANLSDFPVNKWGYKKDSGNFIPFASPTTILESDTYANDDTTTLSFATKIDYLQESGTYNTTFQFNTVANPICNTTISGTMQSFIPCSDIVIGTTGNLTDVRDGEEYAITKLGDGHFWMTKDLRFIGSTSDPAGTMTLNSSTSNIDSIYTKSNPLILTYYDPTSSMCDHSNALINLCALKGSNSYTDGVTAWYNYAAASAGTITGSSNSDADIYDICPKGWRLPTASEATGVLGYMINSHFGGGYDNQSTWFPSQRAYFWTSNTYSSNPGLARNAFRYISNGWQMDLNGPRYFSWFIRCILKES